MTNEYRVTVKPIYSDPNCPGYTNLSARQGHYYCAEDETDLLCRAFQDLSIRLHGTVKSYKDLDVQLWKKDIKHAY